MKFLSDKIIVKFDTSSENIQIFNPNEREFPDPLVNIAKNTYSDMSFTDAAEFLGSRLLLLMPSMREHFKDELAQLASSEHGLSKRDLGKAG
jgi:hypothetical protein